MGKYLFVCHQNRQRSPFAELWLSRKFKERRIESEVKSAGISVGLERESVQLTQDLVDWAEIMFFMEDYMVDRIRGKYERLEGKIKILNIPCNFDPEYEDPEEVIKMTAEEALRYFNSNPDHIDIGKNLMAKILEAKLSYLFK